jgi:hypothetical protein
LHLAPSNAGAGHFTFAKPINGELQMSAKLKLSAAALGTLVAISAMATTAPTPLSFSLRHVTKGRRRAVAARII